MVIRPSVLCPIDFSDASRGALRHAAALAEHFYAVLTVLTVDDQLMTNATNAAFGEGWLKARTAKMLEEFVFAAFPERKPQLAELRLLVETGTPAAEILRCAGDTHADAIVMSTHGITGPRKLMFGSTTERVLRETHVPVIVTPATDPGPTSLEQWRGSVKTVVVPVDFSEYTPRQLRMARGLAEAFGCSLLLAHVLEPVRSRPGSEHIARQAESVQRAQAQRKLDELASAVPPALNPTIVLGGGNPAMEIARIAREHEASVIVMGLHSTPGSGRQMGTVTYRLLCESPTLVVAWPPQRAESRLTFAA